MVTSRHAIAPLKLALASEALCAKTRARHTTNQVIPVTVTHSFPLNTLNASNSNPDKDLEAQPLRNASVLWVEHVGIAFSNTASAPHFQAMHPRISSSHPLR